MEEEFDVDVETIEPINVGKHGSDAHLASQDDDDRWIALEPDDDTVLDCTPVLDVLERESEDEDEA